MKMDLQIKVIFDPPNIHTRKIMQKALADFMKATKNIRTSCELSGEFAQWVLREAMTDETP